MLPVRFEPTISAGEQPHTVAFDRAATGTDQIGFIAVTALVNVNREVIPKYIG